MKPAKLRGGQQNPRVPKSQEIRPAGPTENKQQDSRPPKVKPPSGSGGGQGSAGSGE